jgi:hypothetical protein
MPTLITVFAVAPDADDAFVSAWQPASPAATLHRALRADADFRFVEVGEGDEAGRAAGSVPAHRGVYEVVREDGTPDVEGFLAGWDRARGALTQQQGYLGTRLHHAAGPAHFRFVNIARWSSPLMFARALQRPEFGRAARAVPFASHPALYQVVRTAGA